uniref:Uncharacterized protein n=1 Tax=Rhizophagus irregularis (strain DAOM 181602 / DAOM 197198 / MUCL 43194) TaxID=747089 RepID=U9UNU0_RHIID
MPTFPMAKSTAFIPTDEASPRTIKIKFLYITKLTTFKDDGKKMKVKVNYMQENLKIGVQR